MTAPTAVIALATIPSAQSAIVARLCRLFGRAVTNKLIEGVLPGSELVIAGPDLAELEAITDSAQTRCWNPEFTYANDLARKGPLAQGATIAQLILAFVPLGLKGRYQVRLPYPEWLMLETNRFRCAGLTTIAITDGDTAVTCDDDAFSFKLTDGLWRDIASDNPTVARGANNSLIYVSGYSVDPEMLLAEDRALDMSQVTPAHQTLDKAFALLAQAGDDVRNWVTAIISRISIVSSEGGARLSSRSISARAGNIQIAAPGDELHIAELMVHEAAHQYFHLAQLYGAVTDPNSSGKLFYSAINGRYRPLERVALAYHAIANMFELLDRLIAENTVIASDALCRLNDLGKTEYSLRTTLEQAWNDLTPFGQAFCRPMLRQACRIVERYAVPAERTVAKVVWGGA